MSTQLPESSSPTEDDEIPCAGECDGHTAPEKYLFDGLCIVCRSRRGDL